jgi:cytochrome c oxidase assembly factor 5
MSSSCQVLLDALKDCILYSDCVVKQGYLPSQCLKEHTDELPESCRNLRKATFECKRGMVRMHMTAAQRYSLTGRVTVGYEEKI